MEYAKCAQNGSIRPMRKSFFGLILLLLAIVPSGILFAQTTTLAQDQVDVVKARVDSIISQSTGNVPDTGVKSIYQTLDATVLEGSRQNQTVVVNNGYFFNNEAWRCFLSFYYH